MLALRQTTDLANTVALLCAEGFAPLALKGAWLCRHAYPHPALRPMRDIDLLLDHASVIPAFEHLRTAGYELCAPPELSLPDLVRIDKHLPPLISPGGTTIELHHRLWVPDGRLDHASPSVIDDRVRAHAVLEDDGILYPAPIDMLAHLIVHSVYGHRFDCGPLVLTDIDYLLRARGVDWALFWQRAESEGWRSGARLLLALVAAYRSDVQIRLTPAAGPEPSPEIMADAVDLLLQDLATRQSAGVLATVKRHGWRGTHDRMLGRNRTSAALVTRQKSAEGGFVRWAIARLGRTLGDLQRTDPRHQGLALARLSHWLDQAEG